MKDLFIRTFGLPFRTKNDRETRLELLLKDCIPYVKCETLGTRKHLETRILLESIKREIGN